MDYILHYRLSLQMFYWDERNIPEKTRERTREREGERERERERVSTRGTDGWKEGREVWKESSNQKWVINSHIRVRVKKITHEL